MNEQEIESAVVRMERELAERWELLEAQRQKDDKKHASRFNGATVTFTKDDRMEVHEANGVFATVELAEENFPGFVVGWLGDLIQSYCDRAGEGELTVLIDPFIDIEHEHVEGEQFSGYRFTSKAAFLVTKGGV